MSGNNRPQSSQLAESLWTDPGLKSGISVRELISTLKKKKKNAGEDRMVEHYPEILANEQKATTTTTKKKRKKEKNTPPYTGVTGAVADLRYLLRQPHAYFTASKSCRPGF